MSKPFVPRKHQADATRIAQDIADGRLVQKLVVAAVTPGGGKSAMAAAFARELVVANVVDYVLVVCPREALVRQMVDSFASYGRSVGGGPGLVAAPSDRLGQRQLQRTDRGGYATTYQAIVADPKRYEKLLAKDRWLLVLDECQSLSAHEEATWGALVTRLHALAKQTLLMGASMAREDKAPVALVPYDAERNPIVDIRYSRRDALDEKAVLRVSVRLCDGTADYWHKYVAHQTTLSEATSKQEGLALRTVLADEGYRGEMLKLAIQDWASYRETHYASRMIVICETQQATKSVARYIRENFRWEVVRAISEDGPDSKRVLAKFRDARQGEILVTCQMAYIGLDVPDCTHLICLTNIRSRSWLDQAFARVTRFNSDCRLPWEKQFAYWFVPNDPSMVRYLDEALDEQDERFGGGGESGGGAAPKRGSTFSPIDGSMGAQRFGDTNGVFSDADSALIHRARTEHPALVSIAASDLLPIARRMYAIPADDEAAE